MIPFVGQQRGEAQVSFRREGQGLSNVDGGNHSWVTCFDPCYSHPFSVRGEAYHILLYSAGSLWRMFSTSALKEQPQGARYPAPPATPRTMPAPPGSCHEDS